MMVARPTIRIQISVSLFLLWISKSNRCYGNPSTICASGFTLNLVYLTYAGLLGSSELPFGWVCYCFFLLFSFLFFQRANQESERERERERERENQMGDFVTETPFLSVGWGVLVL